MPAVQEALRREVVRGIPAPDREHLLHGEDSHPLWQGLVDGHATDPAGAARGNVRWSTCDADCAFSQGYLEAGGPPHYLRHLIEDCPVEVYEYPWPHDEACSVSWCESRWQPDAIGGDNYSYFQVNAIHWRRTGAMHREVGVDLLLVPAINVRVAYDIWRDAGGWGPWACKPY